MSDILDRVRENILDEIVAAADQDLSGFEVLGRDPYLKPFFPFFADLRRRIRESKQRLGGESGSLLDFATAHEFFGLHFQPVAKQSKQPQWVFREWAPAAKAIWLIGSFSGWQREERFRLQPIGWGRWEGVFPAEALRHCDLYRLSLDWEGGNGERIPAYVRRVVQDPHSKMFSAQVWQPPQPFQWQVADFRRRDEPLLIYEAHVGMAQQDPIIGSYRQFQEDILPRVIAAGYNAIQFMAIQEHPYYGSFGYQVSSFFAPSSRFGTPEELKELVDAAHAGGVAVLLDLVHSHAVKNEIEGLSRLDGTLYQYFHNGSRGEHPVWDSRLFDYAKTEVLHFLLSNVRYWLEEFQFDGFRFDGVTSMLYHDHGLGEPFSSYDRYFGGNLDRDAVAYLALANELAHNVKADVITIAEDVSGFPGLAVPRLEGGVGFDYRLAMGVPDFWVRTIKQRKDEDWNVEWMFWELINRRVDEKTISYAESHDQALVGDQTLIFRLLQTEMYYRMRIDQQNVAVERGVALHCLIRLITIATAGHGYLNFMGNEFGHPEWIDFPRDGNNWSCHHARRLWHLRDDPALQYQRLALFDQRMLQLAKEQRLFDDPVVYKHLSHVHDQVLVFSRADTLFFFNFNPFQSFCDYPVAAPVGSWRLALCSDDWQFGGQGRVVADQVWTTQTNDGGREGQIKVYLPTRTALVCRRCE